ncbi:Nuclear transcription factor Y subunit C-9 [Heracleum sosnowskyi]|uniref:Nuclear transcription factor Y subunit C-9 n=1 Tax=Heracleum sosnowskyi TaxID=360622 RepID=A0AAD8ILX8_9APIA|nr:Nuclear transcription factor Y subunit C-9 [Heracleum sosnowskyi]
MDQSEESQQQQEQVINGAGQMVPHYHAGAGVLTATPMVPMSVPNGSTSHQQYYQQQQQRQQSELQEFWDNQMLEIEETTDFKNHSLPLARIKKIMKADEDVRMISSEAPVVFAKACEMFVMELTKRSWLHTEENKRRTLQKNDIAAAISKTDVYDFLVDIIPRDELKEEGPAVTRAAVPLLLPPADPVPYYYVPQQQQHAMGQGGFYPDQHPYPPPPYMPWQNPQQHQNHEENGNSAQG